MLINHSLTILLLVSLLAIGGCTTSTDHHATNETITSVRDSYEGTNHSSTIEPEVAASNSSHLTSVELKTSSISTTEAPLITIEVSNASTSSKPIVEHTTETPSTKSVHVSVEQVTSTVAPHEDRGPVPKFCEYLKPICASLDEISSKLLFRFQTQFKQFVQLTNGKLGMCFLEHYDIDPTLKALTKADLAKICESKDLSPTSKGSIKKFEACAAENWDPAVDKELSRIIDARLNCIRYHNHTGKSMSNSSLEEHDNEDMSLINEVVSKVLNEEKSSSSSVSNSSINIIDMSSKTNSSSDSKQSHSSLTPEAKGLLNDPNTVVVFVDDSSSSKPTAEPTISVQKITTSASGQHNSTSKISSSLNSTTTVPSLGDKLIKSKSEHSDEIASKKIDSHESSSNDTRTTEKPTELVVASDKKTTALPHVSVTEVSLANLLKESSNLMEHKWSNESSEEESSKSTTSRPSSNSVKVELKTTITPKPTTTTTATPVSVKKVEVLPVKTTLAPTTIKPQALAASISVQAKPKEVSAAKSTKQAWETLEEILKRQEKEKIEFEARLRVERENLMRLLQKSKDENDAQSAMKSLRLQRESSNNHATDNKLHQLEHERQMAIDPVGHIIKHQQYELNKQQRLAGSKA